MNIVIETERLVLRPLSLEDLHTTHQYAGDSSNAQYMVYLPNESIEETRQFLINVEHEWEKEHPGFFEFAILLSNQHIGAVSLHFEDDRTVGELGWIIHRDHWGKGIAPEAAAAVKTFATEQLAVKRLIAHCDSRNTGSIRVMEKIGMSLESDSGTRCNKASQQPVTECLYSLNLE